MRQHVIHPDDGLTVVQTELYFYFIKISVLFSLTRVEWKLNAGIKCAVIDLKGSLLLLRSQSFQGLFMDNETEYFQVSKQERMIVPG